MGPEILGFCPALRWSDGASPWTAVEITAEGFFLCHLILSAVVDSL